MIGSHANAFAGPGSWQVPEKLVALGLPAHEVIAGFIHGCSPDPATRTVAATALVLSLWQLKGRSLTPEVPSLLLIHTGEAEHDPIDEFVRDIVYDTEENKPRVQTEGAFMGAPVALAPKAMKNAFLKRRGLGGDIPAAGYEAKNAEEKFHAAPVAAFGHGSCRPYAEAWHPEYGLLTGDDGQLILRLNGESDRAVFCGDVADDPGKLAFAKGAGADLSMVPKSISLSGSLKPGDWKGKTVGMSIALGWPLFALPHVADTPLDTGDGTAIQSFAMMWKHAGIRPVNGSLRLPASDWVSAYQTALRRRLAKLPGTYEFAVLQAVHQLDGVCDRIANFAAGKGAKLEGRVALCRNLYGHALRGIVLGVAGLSFFGRGLHLGTEGEPLRSEAIRLLKYLREKGATTKSTILQNLHLKKRQRDILLEHLAAEDLLRVEGATVSATTFPEFVAVLYGRDEFPQVAEHREEVREGGEGAEASG